MKALWRIRSKHEDLFAFEAEGKIEKIVGGANDERKYALESGQSVAEVLRKSFTDAVIGKPALAPGEYRPRVSRGDGLPTTHQQGCVRECQQGLHSVGVVVARLREVFRVVEPSEANLSVFGQEIRNLLIVACTEVEASLRAVLRANRYPGNEKNWKTCDYRKLLRPMRLDEWSIGLSLHPDSPTVTPLRGLAARSRHEVAQVVRRLQFHEA